jgi:sporadic carbohydrate cluster 2OG-Fe(II) oxygenase
MGSSLVCSYDDIHYHYRASGKSRKGLDLLRDFILAVICAKFPGLEKLEYLHSLCDPVNVNELRLFVFDQINTHFDWKKALIESCGDNLAKLLGPNIYIQKKINLSIQLPNDPSSILPTHSDCMSGDSPFQLNMWIPLTRAYASNTMFLVSRELSLRLISEQIDRFRLRSSFIRREMDQTIYDSCHINESSKYYVNAFPGDYIIFNPAVLHGNELNTTSSTRISLNVRLAAIGAPSPLAVNTDRSFSTYYEPFVANESHFFSARLYSILKSRAEDS